jgi:hypothetical protein
MREESDSAARLLVTVGYSRLQMYMQIASNLRFLLGSSYVSELSLYAYFVVVDVIRVYTF